MKVSELVEALKDCDQNAIVEVEDCESTAIVERLEKTFYNHPANKYVLLKSALSFEPNEARINQKELQILRGKLLKIKELLGKE